MLISELIALLNDYQDKWGNIPVYMASGTPLNFYAPDFKQSSLILAHDKRCEGTQELSSYEYTIDDHPNNYYYKAVELVPPEHRAETILSLWIDYED